ncbi:hypothetical protein DH2020_019195 [Rehmannia glutinosa]|uniref:Uncharacterized protein n=1 Tax=Rehmannia glutinosa TaxID=99300 RepID=A0ABR0WL40_REHGL
MADAALTFLVENVSQLLKSHVDLISGAEKELEQLKNELCLLKAFLHQKPTKEELFREIERQIKEVVYDAEGIIDNCLTQADAAKGRNFVRRILNPNRVSFAEEVKSLREDKVKPMFDKLAMRITDIHISDGRGSTVEEPWAKVKKVQLNRQDNIIGFKDEEEEIIAYLKQENEELGVISIIGMGGIGKTTLAWKVFRDPRIEYEFPTRIWVCISSDLRKRNVYLDILGRLTKLTDKISSMSDGHLVQTIRSHLEEKKFLIVMDDVWSAQDWDDLQVALPIRNRRSKILITSRQANLVRLPNSRNHHLRFLNPEDCWKLLQSKLFGEASCPPELEEVGKSIAHRCAGLPLSVVMIAGILSGETNRNTWQKVLESTNTLLLRERFIENLMSLSYNSLSDPLKPCFLYMGMFPEDFEISVWKLTRMWVAEGFVLQVPGMSLEEVAMDYLEELINRNLVMVDKVRPDGKVKTCRVHDILHQFCQIKAGSNENLFQEVRKSLEGIFEPLISKHRSICLHSNVLDFFSSEPFAPFVRSFLCFSKDESVLRPEQISLIPCAFKLLRVLDVKPIRFTRFPLELTLLFHLRYIVLSSDFKVLPEAVSKLRNTQTLIIDTTSRTLKIKADMWKMIQLRHVKTNTSIILLKSPENNQGKNLLTLANISPESCTKDVFDQACYLKKLGVRGRLAILLADNNGKFDSLGKLSSLENLKLLNDVHPNPPSEGQLPCLPLPNKFPPKLRSLTLSATFLNWEQMSVLGNLKNLEVLKLKDNAFVGECWEVEDDGLMLRNCEELEAVPEGLANIQSLQVMELHRTSKTAAASPGKFKRKYYKSEDTWEAMGLSFRYFLQMND